MAYDERLASRVRRLLSKRKDVVERKMMGKLAFMVNGSMCCSVGPESLLVRISKDERQQVLESPHVKPMLMGGRTMTGFVRVSAKALGTDDALAQWVERGIAAGGARKQGALATSARRKPSVKAKRSPRS